MVKRQTLLTLLLLFMLAWLQGQLWFGDGGLGELRHLRDLSAGQRMENRQLSQRNQGLAAEVVSLKHTLQAVEERARMDLGLIKPGETFYRFVEPTGRD